jgi:hypothetical protein
MAQDRDHWRALVKTAINILVMLEVPEWLHNWRPLENGLAPWG